MNIIQLRKLSEKTKSKYMLKGTELTRVGFSYTNDPPLIILDEPLIFAFRFLNNVSKENVRKANIGLKKWVELLTKAIVDSKFNQFRINWKRDEEESKLKTAKREYSWKVLRSGTSRTDFEAEKLRREAKIPKTLHNKYIRIKKQLEELVNESNSSD